MVSCTDVEELPTQWVDVGKIHAEDGVNVPPKMKSRLVARGVCHNFASRRLAICMGDLDHGCFYHGGASAEGKLE